MSSSFITFNALSWFLSSLEKGASFSFCSWWGSWFSPLSSSFDETFSSPFSGTPSSALAIRFAASPPPKASLKILFSLSSSSRERIWLIPNLLSSPREQGSIPSAFSYVSKTCSRVESSLSMIKGAFSRPDSLKLFLPSFSDNSKWAKPPLSVSASVNFSDNMSSTRSLPIFPTSLSCSFCRPLFLFFRSSILSSYPLTISEIELISSLSVGSMFLKTLSSFS